MSTINDPRWRERHLVKQVVSSIEQAKAGDVLAAKDVLRNAMVALSHVIEGNDPGKPGVEALRFVHESIRLFIVDEVPFDRSFCVDKETGAPAKNMVGESIYITLLVEDELNAQLKSDQAQNVGSAIKKVANKIVAQSGKKCSTSKVRAAWQSCGGEKGFNDRKNM